MRGSHGPLGVRERKWHELGHERRPQLGLEQHRHVERRQRDPCRRRDRGLRGGRRFRVFVGHELFAVQPRCPDGPGFVRESNHAYLAEQLFGRQFRDGFRG